jgi:flavin reductase (DIM6/NTAB) family NADH-FMN oxidoreductase RutF
VIAQSWKCSSCGYVAIGLFPPESCPKCHAARDAFITEHEFLFPKEETDAVIKACWKVSYGLYVVTSIRDGRANGQVCNTLFQITSDPPRFAIGINHRNLTHEFIASSEVFAASILGVGDHRLVRRFGYRSGRDFDKLGGIAVRAGRTGCPLLEESLGYVECKLLPDKTVDAGTHSIFVGEVVGGGILRDGEPMTYAHYHATKDSAQQS